VTAGIEESRSQLSMPSELAANPNPFTGSTTIRYASLLGAQNEFRLYDAAGNLVRTLSAAGSHVLNGSGLKPGVYVLRAGKQTTRVVKAAH
jgi:hypothetical protein